MGGNWYSRARLGMFEVPKPLATLGIGVDSMPATIKNSKVLTGNDLGKLGNVEALPDDTEIQDFLKQETEIAEMVQKNNEEKIHKQAQLYLEDDEVMKAWKLLLAK